MILDELFFHNGCQALYLICSDNVLFRNSYPWSEENFTNLIIMKAVRSKHFRPKVCEKTEPSQAFHYT